MSICIKLWFQVIDCKYFLQNLTIYFQMFRLRYPEHIYFGMIAHAKLMEHFNHHRKSNIPIFIIFGCLDQDRISRPITDCRIILCRNCMDQDLLVLVIIFPRALFLFLQLIIDHVQWLDQYFFLFFLSLLLVHFFYWYGN